MEKLAARPSTLSLTSGNVGAMPVFVSSQDYIAAGKIGYLPAGGEYTNSNVTAKRIDITGGKSLEKKRIQSMQKHEYIGAQSSIASPYFQSNFEEDVGMFQQKRLWFEDSDADGSFDHFQLKMNHTSPTSPHSCQD